MPIFPCKTSLIEYFAHIKSLQHKTKARYTKDIKFFGKIQEYHIQIINKDCLE